MTCTSGSCPAGPASRSCSTPSCGATGTTAECRDWDDVKYTIGEREREVRNMMEAAFRDPVQAFRNELERLVRSFNPNLPYPEVAVTVSSTDGRTIVEFDPAGKSP